jgi:exodeoxyribonuclease VII large subunit
MSQFHSAFDFLFQDHSGQSHHKDGQKEARGPSLVEKAGVEIWTVSRLVSTIHSVLNNSFGTVWLRGEVSNLSQPASGHLYFTLKDETAQIKVVMFKRSLSAVSFAIKEGLEVVIRGEISVYAGRGDLQVIADYLEPAGEGALKLAFEALKKELSARGWFDEGRKRPLPPIPHRVFLITSPTGAVVHDFLRTALYRFPAAHVVLTPSRVQGEGAGEELKRAVELASSVAQAGDVIVLARGGGSLEDLWAFNDEGLAEAVLKASVPVVSAVGHEVDFTICDFVADKRAATPTAAAQMVFPAHVDLEERVFNLANALKTGIKRLLQSKRVQVENLSLRLIHPKQRLNDARIRLDYRSQRLLELMSQRIARRSHGLLNMKERLMARSPVFYIRERRQQLDFQQRHLSQAITALFLAKKQAVFRMSGILNAISPLNVLARGYSIVTRAQNGEVVRNATQITRGELLKVQPQKGVVFCRAVAVQHAHSEEE